VKRKQLLLRDEFVGREGSVDDILTRGSKAVGRHAGMQRSGGCRWRWLVDTWSTGFRVCRLLLSEALKTNLLTWYNMDADSRRACPSVKGVTSSVERTSETISHCSSSELQLGGRKHRGRPLRLPTCFPINATREFWIRRPPKGIRWRKQSLISSLRRRQERVQQ
jgi:hypothetical protein